MCPFNFFLCNKFVVCVHSHMCMHVCAYVGGGIRETLGVFLDGSPLYLLRHGLSWNLKLAGGHLSSCLACPRHPAPISSQLLGVQVDTTLPGFYMSSGNPNSSCHACVQDKH